MYKVLVLGLASAVLAVPTARRGGLSVQQVPAGPKMPSHKAIETVRRKYGMTDAVNTGGPHDETASVQNSPLNDTVALGYAMPVTIGNQRFLFNYASDFLATTTTYPAYFSSAHTYLNNATKISKIRTPT